LAAISPKLDGKKPRQHVAILAPDQLNFREMNAVFRRATRHFCQVDGGLLLISRGGVLSREESSKCI